MCAVINRITITEAFVSKKEEGLYSIYGSWETKQSGCCRYTGAYFMQLISNGSIIKEEKIEQPSGEVRQYGFILYDQIEKDSWYYLNIFDETRQELCEKVMLLFDTYENVRGSYDGKRIHLTWGKPSTLIHNGSFVLTSNDGSTYSHAIPKYSRHLDMKMSLEDFDSDPIWTAHLHPKLNEKSEGPESENLFFFCSTIDIQTVTDHKVNESPNMTSLTIEFKQVYDLSREWLSPNEPMVQAVLSKDGKEVKIYPPVAMPKPVGDIYTIKLEVPDEVVNPDTLAEYTLSLFLCSGNTVTKIVNEHNTITLEKTDIFRKGFYPVLTNHIVTSLAYREQRLEESEIQITFYEELFQTKITDLLSVSGIALKSLDTFGYQLTLITNQTITAENYHTFLKLLSDKGITAKGMYLIEDTISRCGNINLSDLLYFHCGLNIPNRSADVRPGFLLKVETAAYQPIYDADTTEDGMPGFISTHTACYQVSSRADGNDIRLEFDSFLDQFSDTILIQYTGNVLAGGLLDFFSDGMKQPYYKLIYPKCFLSSDLEGTKYQSDNVLLVAAPLYSQLEEAAEGLMTMVSYDNANANTPIFMFRGRSAVSLNISIQYQQHKETVPVGTTLKKFLESKGIFHSSTGKVILKRMSVSGFRNVSLYIETESITDQYWNQLPLMLGDRIEVLS